MRGLFCDACYTIMTSLAKDVKFLVETDKMWKKKDLQGRIMASCMDPTMPTGSMRDACGYVLEDYMPAMEAEIALRWTPSAEEFQEGIIPREFCHKIKVCKEGQQDINEMIARSDRRQKDLDEEKADKEKAKAKKAAKAAAKKSKADEEED